MKGRKRRRKEGNRQGWGRNSKIEYKQKQQNHNSNE